MVKVGYEAFSIDSSNIPSIMLFAGIRFVICGIVMVAMVSCRDKKLELPGKDKFKVIAAIGAVSIIVHYALTYFALSVTEGAKTAILKQIGFLLLPCFAFMFRKEDKFSVTKVLGAVIGFVAIIVINLDGLRFNINIGDIAIIGASIASVASTIMSKNAYDKYDSSYVVAYSQLFGGIVLMVAGFISGGSMNMAGINSVLVLAYMCAASIGAYLLWGLLTKYNDMSKLSIIKFLEPFLGAVFSAIILG